MRHVFFTVSFLFAACLLFVGCTQPQLAGGTSTSENGRFTGRILDPHGVPAKGVRVLLLPADYDPVKGSAVVVADTTDSLGNYTLQKVNKGYYTILAMPADKKTSTMIRGIQCRDSADTVATDTLRVPGSVNVTLPANANTVNGYVYIPGTFVFALLVNTTKYVILDSVPAGVLLDVAYSTTSATTPTILRYGLDVKSSDTSVVWNTEWNYSRKITLNTTTTGANVAGMVTNFPVLIRLTATNFDFTKAKNNGEDIRFAKSNSTSLPYEIERWDSNLRQAEIWVKLDTIYGSNDAQFIAMYWGNSAATSASNGAAVFDTTNGFQGVWHLNQKCDDATYGRNNGTNYGTIDTTGIIGACKKFNGSDSIKIAGLLGSPANITLSAWAQLDSVSGGEYGGEVLSIGDAALIRMDYSVLDLGTYGAIHPVGDTVYYTVTTGQFLKQTGWHLITFTVDQNNHSQTLYIDGSVVRSRSGLISIDYSGVGQNTFMGTHGNGKAGYNFSGRIDEVRVSNIPLNPDWIKLCFMNQKEQDVLVKW